MPDTDTTPEILEKYIYICIDVYLYIYTYIDILL